MSLKIPERDLERSLWFVRRVLTDEIIRAETVADMTRAAEGIESSRRLGDAWEAERARYHTPQSEQVAS